MVLKDIWSWIRKDRINRDILKTSLALLYNAAYALFNLILAWSYQSEWYLMMAMFLFPLCIMRFLLLLEWKKNGENNCRPDILHVSGFIMLFLVLVMASIVYVTSIQQVTEGHGEIVMITIATYTFTKLGFAIVRTIKDKKNSRSFSKVIRDISYAELTASMLSLQRTMIISFGNENHEWAHMMNIISGSVACLFIAAIGISMISYRRDKDEIENRRSK